MGYQYNSAPAQEPVSLAEAKAHLRVDFDDDDAYINNLLRATRWKIERRYRFFYMTQTVTLALDSFGMPERTRDIQFPVSWWPPAGYQYPVNTTIELRPPVQSVSSVSYVDPSGNTQVLDPSKYLVDTISHPGRISPSLSNIWPVPAAIPNCVLIQFIAGYTDPRFVPENLKLALLLTMSDYYENREDTVIGTRLVALPLPNGASKLLASANFPLVR